MTVPRVTVAVVQRESFGHTKRSLDSLYAGAGAPFDLIYLDAGSPPPVQRLIEVESHVRGFSVLRSEQFISPNATRNRALAVIDTEFVAFVDNDVLFRDGWLRQLLACADETGADLVGPLIFQDDPPFRIVHSYGGDAHVEETGSGFRFYETHPHLEVPVARITEPFVRHPSEMLELHCMLVRRSVFDRVGPFDEGLSSLSEHLDLCMLVRASGGSVVHEPAAVVNHLLPKPFPLDLQSLPFFYDRWTVAKNRASTDHFRAKWNLPPDDKVTQDTYHWCNDRRYVIFRYLKPLFFLRGMRKVLRIAGKAATAMRRGWGVPSLRT